MCVVSVDQGLKPEIVPSKFAEDFPHKDHANDLAGYPVATVSSASHLCFRDDMTDNVLPLPAPYLFTVVQATEKASP
jgi:hypothetical protein